MIDKKELKSLALAATPGRNFDRLIIAGGGLKYECTGDDGSLILKVDHKNDEWGFVGDNGPADEEFFLACTPAIVLSLISEIEALRKDAERYRWLRNPSDGVVVRDRLSHLIGDHMDSRVDAAMSKGADK